MCRFCSLLTVLAFERNNVRSLIARHGADEILDAASDACLILPVTGARAIWRSNNEPPSEPSMCSYPTFADFNGMEEAIGRIVGFFRHAAQGLEERKQILYLLGPVGGGKSALAERLRALMEVHPIHVLKAATNGTPHGIGLENIGTKF
jgi:PrkA AAA domain